MSAVRSAVLQGLLFLWSSVSLAQPMTLESLLNAATTSSPRAKSWELDQMSAKSDMTSKDLALATVFAADASMGHDRRESFGRPASEQGRVASIESTVEVPFATGTTLSLFATHEQIEREDLYGNRNAANWEARLSQSIWRDGFGRGTDLRREGDTIEFKIRLLSILQERQSYLIDVETAFWDLVEASKIKSIYQKNLARRTSLERWTKNRITQFAAENQDLLQVQTLLGQLQLNLSSVENDIATAQLRLKQLVPGVDPSAWTLDHATLEVDRDETRLTASEGTGTPVRIDAFLSSLKAKQAKTASLAVEDSLMPDVSPYVSYGASGIEPQLSRSWGQASQARKNVARIGVRLAMDLDADLKNEKQTSSRLQAESEAIKADVLAKESQLAWQDLQRSVSFLRKQVKAARVLSDLQSKKVAAEKSRFEQGRTTTLQMTTFEVDAAESELRLYQLLRDLRRSETAARNFVFEGTAQL